MALEQAKLNKRDINKQNKLASEEAQKITSGFSGLVDVALEKEIMVVTEFCRNDKLTTYTMSSLIRDGKLAALINGESNAAPPPDKKKKTVGKLRAAQTRFGDFDWDQNIKILKALRGDTFNDELFQNDELEGYQPHGFVCLALNVNSKSFLPHKWFPQCAEDNMTTRFV